MRTDRRIAWIVLALAWALFLGLPRLGWYVGDFLRGGGSSGPDEVSVLRAEILRIKTEEAVRRDESSPPRREEVRAFVYSRYPFNFKDELTIGAGSDQGIRPGDAVLAGEVFIGRVESVSRETALVTTVFDADFRTSVRIGSVGADALLVGGVSPKLTLIPKEARLTEGDPVYSAFVGAPYGIPVGEVRDIRLSEDNLFLEGSLSVPVNPSSLVEVSVVRFSEGVEA